MQGMNTINMCSITLVESPSVMATVKKYTWSYLLSKGLSNKDPAFVQWGLVAVFVL